MNQKQPPRGETRMSGEAAQPGWAAGSGGVRLRIERTHAMQFWVYVEMSDAVPKAIRAQIDAALSDALREAEKPEQEEPTCKRCDGPRDDAMREYCADCRTLEPGYQGTKRLLG